MYVSVPSRIGAHCPYFQKGYGILVVWNQPYGVWTDVEVIVAGQNHTVHQDAEQSVIMSGLQPATTHHVSVTVLSASLSGPPSRSETFNFSCLTDPRGECRHIFPPTLNCITIPGQPYWVCTADFSQLLPPSSNPDLTFMQESLRDHFLACWFLLCWSAWLASSCGKGKI